MADETISEKCETLYNKLNSFVTSEISRDVTPKISNLNTEVWGSDTQTGNSRIDTLNTNFNNLDSSITSMESDINNVESDVSNLQTSVNSLNTSITNIYKASGTLTTNTCFSYRTSLGTFRRVGKVVQFEMNDNVKATNTTTRGQTYTYLTIPDGFKPVQNMYFQNMYWLNNEKEHQITFIAQPNGQLNARVWWVQSTTQEVGLLLGATWITNDTTPSQ